jgi:hypothetical protein
MPKTLKALIQASGNTGSAGQSFRNHVAGAVTGARMSEYSRDGWDNWSQSATTVPHDTNVDFFFWFTGPALSVGRYAHIMQPIDTSMVEQADSETIAANLVSTDLKADGHQLSRVTVNFKGRGVYGTYSGGSGTPSVIKNYWAEYSGTLQNVGEQPGPGADVQWEIAVAFASGTYVPPVLGSDFVEINIVQPADAGNFNGELATVRGVTVGQYNAGAPPGSTSEGRFFTDYNDPEGSLVDSTSSDYYLWQDLVYDVQTNGYHSMRFMVGPTCGFQYGRLYYQHRLTAFHNWSTPIQIEWWDTRVYNQYPGA